MATTLNPTTSKTSTWEVWCLRTGDVLELVEGTEADAHEVAAQYGTDVGLTEVSA